jgi:hypothetical protein
VAVVPDSAANFNIDFADAANSIYQALQRCEGINAPAETEGLDLAAIRPFRQTAP